MAIKFIPRVCVCVCVIYSLRSFKKLQFNTKIENKIDHR